MEDDNQQQDEENNFIETPGAEYNAFKKLSPGYKIQQQANVIQYSTPATYYHHQSDTQRATPSYNPYVQANNFGQIGTYRNGAATHHHQPQYIDAVAPSVASHFSTPSSAYNDIHVLPSPKTYVAFGGTVAPPYASPKSTDIFQPAANYYVDYPEATNHLQYSYHGTVAPQTHQLYYNSNHGK